MSAASKTPWKQACFLVTDANGEWVCHTGMGNKPPSKSHESEANAAFIVRSVNAHADLVAALTTTRDNIRTLGPAAQLDVVPVPYREWLAVVDAALAKASRVGSTQIEVG